jgi:hypothetical protein
VWNVSFNAADDGQLTTSGAGHIRFWKMASTFTGLKLQGDIGKFGRSEISDITGYGVFLAVKYLFVVAVCVRVCLCGRRCSRGRSGAIC